MSLCGLGSIISSSSSKQPQQQQRRRHHRLARSGARRTLSHSRALLQDQENHHAHDISGEHHSRATLLIQDPIRQNQEKKNQGLFEKHAYPRSRHNRMPKRFGDDRNRAQVIDSRSGSCTKIHRGRTANQPGSHLSCMLTINVHQTGHSKKSR
jgi:hypothetical protein